MAHLPTSIDITVSLNANLALAQVRCMGGYLTAATAIERRIEMAALEALCEIQRMGEAARRACGIVPGHRIAIDIVCHPGDLA